MRILALLFTAAIALSAQTVDTVNVHFSTAVVAGETTLPAGDCNIQIHRGSNGTVTLLMRSASGPAANIVVNRIFDETGESVYNPHVVLRASDGVYYFERLLLADRSGFQVVE